jgi:hypothetical protein
MKPRHVILVSIDDLRFDAVRWQPEQRYWAGLGIDPGLNTPTMDQLAGECVLFTKCVSNAGYTALSHATLFSGCHGRRHGVVNFHSTACRSDVMTVPEYFAAAGYRTMLLTHPSRRTLFCESNASLRGIDEHYDCDADFLSALHRHRDDPLFAVIHVCDVHDPLVRGGDSAPDPAQGLDWELFLRLVFNGTPADDQSADVRVADGQRNSYANLQSRPPERSAAILPRLQQLLQAYLYTVAKLDRFRFRRLIEGLRASGAWQDTLLVVFSDHGETQSRAYPWRLGHGAVADETVIRVPLMMRIPGVAPCRRDQLVGLVDVLPTLLELAGIRSDKERTFDGRSLMPTIRDDRPAGDEYWIEGWSHQTGDDDPHIVCRALRRADGRKYVWHGDEIDWGRLDGMSPTGFEAYLARVAYGNPATQWLRDRIDDFVRQHGRAGAVRALLAKRPPRHLIFDNVDQDLTEQAGIAVDPAHPRWEEYRGYQEKMSAQTARPCSSAGLSEEDEQRLESHLRELGYVQ